MTNQEIYKYHKHGGDFNHLILLAICRHYKKYGVKGIGTVEPKLKKKYANALLKIGGKDFPLLKSIL